MGTYSVGPLLPGDYIITASHQHWQLEPVSMTHSLSLDSPQLTSPFSIMGYRVTGTVTSRSGPVAGIQVRARLGQGEARCCLQGCSAIRLPALGETTLYH